MGCDSPDVVVIGGGPAGSITSTLLAQQQCRVELFEREPFPRFHIGESLIPETYLLGAEAAQHAAENAAEPLRQEVQSGVSSTPGGKESAPFYFWDNKPHECSQTWQVVRSVTVRNVDGSFRDVRAQVVVDASGKNGLISNRIRRRATPQRTWFPACV